MDRWPAVIQVITPAYFDVLRVPLLSGRGFTSLDTASQGRLTGTGPAAPGVAIVNETMARRYWPGRDPVGQQITVEGDGWVSYRTVVAVTADVLSSPTAVDVQPVVYVPFGQRRRGVHRVSAHREIGVRVALGAGRADVVGLVGRYAARSVLTGVLMGLVAAGAATVDRLVLAETVGVILIVPALAVIAPTRAALAIDPIQTLRSG